MRGFRLDGRGDLVLEKGQLALAEGDELLRKTVEMVLGTARGEWWLDEREGVRLRAILAKNPDYDRIQSEIAAALLLVDGSFAITQFACHLQGRSLRIEFEAVNSTGRKTKAVVGYG